MAGNVRGPAVEGKGVASHHPRPQEEPQLARPYGFQVDGHTPLLGKSTRRPISVASRIAASLNQGEYHQGDDGVGTGSPMSSAGRIDQP
jgi:hypothetical protein